MSVPALTPNLHQEIGLRTVEQDLIASSASTCAHDLEHAFNWRASSTLADVAEAEGPHARPLCIQGAVLMQSVSTPCSVVPLHMPAIFTAKSIAGFCNCFT